MSGVTVKTTGDLRDFLTETMVRVREGTIELAAADRIAKLAGQVTASLQAEAQFNLVNEKVHATPGDLALVSPEKEAPEPRLIEVKPVTRSEPAIRLADPPADKERVFCDQCERRVKPTEAAVCTSPFCKAKADDTPFTITGEA